MWAQWLERILNAHDAEAYAGRRAARDIARSMTDAAALADASPEQGADDVVLPREARDA